MAKNIIHQGSGWLRLELPVTPGLLSGARTLVGAGLAVDLITDADAAGNATVMFPCPYTVSVPVVGHNGTAAAAVAVGDPVYMDGANINVNPAGVLYGYALEAVVSGATTTILVARAA